MFHPEPSEEQWLNQQRLMGAGIKEKFVPRVFPPEPDGFRSWLHRRYPYGDGEIDWMILCQLHPNIIAEFREWDRTRRPVKASHPSIDTLRAWRQAQIGMF